MLGQRGSRGVTLLLLSSTFRLPQTHPIDACSAFTSVQMCLSSLRSAPAYGYRTHRELSSRRRLSRAHTERNRRSLRCVLRHLLLSARIKRAEDTHVQRQKPLKSPLRPPQVFSSAPPLLRSHKGSIFAFHEYVFSTTRSCAFVRSHLPHKNGVFALSCSIAKCCSGADRNNKLREKLSTVLLEKCRQF